MIFDAVVLAAVILSSIVAFLRGFIRECLTIVGVIGGLAAAYFGGPFLIPLMRGWLGVTETPAGEEAKKLFDIVPMTIVADVCAYGAIFIIVVIVLSVLSHFLSAGAKAVGLGPVDRTLGVVFGIARAVLLLALLYLPVLLLTGEKERDEWFADSRSRVYIEGTAKAIAAYLPKDAEKTADTTARDTNEKINETRKRLEDMEVLKNTADKANQILDQGKETLQNMQQPAPANDAEGYQGEERQDMNQLIESNQ